MTTRFSRPDGARWEISDKRIPYGDTDRTRVNISVEGVFTVCDALELAEAITYEARRAEEKNLHAILAS